MDDQLLKGNKIRRLEQKNNLLSKKMNGGI